MGRSRAKRPKPAFAAKNRSGRWLTAPFPPQGSRVMCAMSGRWLHPLQSLSHRVDMWYLPSQLFIKTFRTCHELKSEMEEAMKSVSTFKTILPAVIVSIVATSCSSIPRPHWKDCDARALAAGYTLEDLYAGGPSNEDNGFGNRIYGKGNKVTGDDNCIIGEDNNIQGNRNTVTGNRNAVGG